MKTLVTTCLLALGVAVAAPSVGDNSFSSTKDAVTEIAAVATTVKDQAAVDRELDLELQDHFGNPDHFIQYIIRIPPVHA